MLTSDYEVGRMAEDTRASYLRARKQGDVLEARQKRDHQAMIVAGHTIDVKDAMARCFAAGNSGVQKIKGY